MKAICRIRHAPAYRREAWLSGLKAAGYELVDRGVPKSADDLLVIWNRYGDNEVDAARWEGHGGTVLVTENGYAGKDDKGRQYYAVAVHGHNGSGWWPVGPEERWSQLGIELKPWRTEGKHLLVCAQRGIGSKTMASPYRWAEETADRLRKLTDRPVRIRLHPGNTKAPAVSLLDDLRDAWACVIWSSGCGVQALIQGVPVFFSAPAWIGQGAAKPGIDAIEAPMRDDDARLKALQRMAWAQWSVEEIGSGAPFIRIRQAVAERGV